MISYVHVFRYRINSYVCVTIISRFSKWKVLNEVSNEKKLTNVEILKYSIKNKIPLKSDAHNLKIFRQLFSDIEKLNFKKF